MHAAPANARGLIGYSLYGGHPKYPKTITWRPRTTINHCLNCQNHFTAHADIQ